MGLMRRTLSNMVEKMGHGALGELAYQSGVAPTSPWLQLRALAAIADGSPEFIALWNEGLEPIFLNEAGCRLVGLDCPEEVRSLTVRDLIPPDEASRFDNTVFPTVQRTGRWCGEGRLRHTKSGEVFPVMWNTFAVYEDGEKTSGWATIAYDLRPVKKAEEERRRLVEAERAARMEAERASRLKDDFLATVSHELRTPLNAILGWAQLLVQRRVDAERAAPVIEQNARAQAQLIDDLLDVSRMFSGTLHLEFQPTRVTEIVRKAYRTVWQSAYDKRITLNMAIPDDVGSVEGEPGRLQQVAVNLLSNAIKFTPEGGTVTVALAERDGRIELVVSDTGEGIEPDMLPHVFDAFRQEDTSITRRFQGLGVGLAISRQIVELHRGTVKVDSPGKGQGATFTVTLPVMSEAERAEREPRGSRPAEEKLAPGLVVLVIDDDPQSVELLKNMLGSHGVRVLEALSAQRALSLLEKEQVDLIISDIGMPEMDGYALMRTIRHFGDSRRLIPSIALTAYTRPEDRKKALESGYTFHVTKPLDTGTLLRAISSIVSGHAGTPTPAFAM